MSGFGDGSNFDDWGHARSGPRTDMDASRHDVDGWKPKPRPAAEPVKHLNEGPRPGGDYTSCTCGWGAPLSPGVSYMRLFRDHVNGLEK